MDITKKKTKDIIKLTKRKVNPKSVNGEYLMLYCTAYE